MWQARLDHLTLEQCHVTTYVRSPSPGTKPCDKLCQITWPWNNAMSQARLDHLTLEQSHVTTYVRSPGPGTKPCDNLCQITWPWYKIMWHDMSGHMTMCLYSYNILTMFGIFTCTGFVPFSSYILNTIYFHHITMTILSYEPARETMMK